MEQANNKANMPPVQMKREPKLYVLGLIVAGASIVANLIVWYFTRFLATDFLPLSVPPIIIWTVLGTSLALFVFKRTRKWSATPRRSFLKIALYALLVSFTPDVALVVFEVPGVTFGAVAALMSMHVITFSIIVLVIGRYTKE